MQASELVEGRPTVEEAGVVAAPELDAICVDPQLVALSGQRPVEGCDRRAGGHERVSEVEVARPREQVHRSSPNFLRYTKNTRLTVPPTRA